MILKQLSEQGQKMINFTPGSKKGRKINSIRKHSNITLFLKALLTAPMTKYQLVEATGMHYDTLQGLMKALKDANVVHICGWARDEIGRSQRPIYSLGGGVDAEKPKRKTMAERSAAYQKRVKARNEPIFEPKTKFVGGSLWA